MVSEVLPTESPKDISWQNFLLWLNMACRVYFGNSLNFI